MAAAVAIEPRFRRGQLVRFIGGSGMIKNHRFENGNWFYLVEMEMGPEPEMGRIGYETTIVISQADLVLQGGDDFSDWAISA